MGTVHDLLATLDSDVVGRDDKVEVALTDAGRRRFEAAFAEKRGKSAEEASHDVKVLFDYGDVLLLNSGQLDHYVGNEPDSLVVPESLRSVPYDEFVRRNG